MATVLSDLTRDFSLRTEASRRVEPFDEKTTMNAAETISVLWRAFKYLLPFKWRFLAKFLFSWGSYLPAIIYPWIFATTVDHVIRGVPVGTGPGRYPPFYQPFVDLLAGQTPVMIMVHVTALAGTLALLFGAYGTGPAQNDDTDGELAQGHDTATKAENDSNIAYSAAAGIYGFIEFRWMLRLTQQLNHYYRGQLFNRVKSLPMSILDDQRIGDTVFRVMYDTPAISRICYDVVLKPTVTLLNLGLILYVMHYSFRDVPWLVYVALAAVPATFVITLPFTPFLRRRSQASRAAGSTTTGTMEEGMNNILAVQSLGGARKQRQRFDDDSKESFGRYRGLYAANVIINLAVSFSGEAMMLIALYIIVMSVIDGTVSAGQYGVLFYYYGWMVREGRGLARLWVVLQDNAVGVRRVFFLMDLPVEKETGKYDLPPISEGVKIENVDLVYSDGRHALKEVSFEGNVGEVIAIVGATGAGKTSLAYLIPRFHTATRGRVTIDGHDVNNVTLDSLRAQVSYVLQETHLFSDTIRNNIRYSNTDATQAEIEAAAKLAGAHEFISELPDGYDTRLGRGGSKLSVGQKQRISIARGLVRDARILILDEPTSAVDPETEAALVKSLEEASKNRLVIVIAHRLSTIRHADRIVLMQSGEIIETGSHDELMERMGGAYRTFVELQTGNTDGGD